MDSDLRETIDFAIKNQISIIPIKHRGKNPTIDTWSPYQQRQPTEAEIQEWFGDRKEHNIGLVGGGPRNTFYIDFDHKKIYEEFFEGDDPETRIVRTTQGYHVYYTAKEPISKDSIGITFKEGGKPKNIDVQGVGAYVIAPPSTHESGNKYRWCNNHSIKHLDITKEQFTSFLYDRTNQICEKMDWTCNKEFKHDVAVILKGVQHGSRNHSGHVLASYYIEIQRKTKEEIEHLLEEWNTNNNPPLPESELFTIIESVFKPGAHTNYKFISKGVVIKKYFDNNGKPNFEAISEDILSLHRFLTLREDIKTIYHYNPDNGLYEPYGDTIILQLCKTKYDRVIPNYWTNEIKSYIQGNTLISRKDLNTNKNLIHLRNGIYDLENDKLLPFSPDIYSTISLPIIYRPNAECPVFEKFLKDVLVKPKMVQLVKELFGYCLHKSYDFQHMFLFYGKRDNGKSKLLDLFNEFLGEDNVSCQSLQDLENKPFARHKLYGKLANTYADLSEKAMKSLEAFKTLTAGDRGDADIKHDRDGIRFKNSAKLIFSCNIPPAFNEDTEAVWKRVKLIHCPNQFIEGINADINIVDKLTNEQELSGIFNIAIESRKRLLERGYFDYDSTIEETRKQYLIKSEPLKYFAENYLIEKIGNEITKPVFFVQFRKFCIDNNVIPPTLDYVGKNLMRFINTVSDKQTTGDQRSRVWKHIAFKEDVNINDNENDNKNIDDYEGDD